jgi:sugar phosphate isomerase/epimerase
MWSQQDRFSADMRDFARVARSLGYDALEVNYVVSREGVEQLLDGAELPIASFHAPSPCVKHSDGRWSEQLNLASTDESERQQAVAYNAATFEWAARAGAGRVVLHLGGIGNEMMEPERRLRRLFDSGVREGEEVEGLREDLRRLRQEQQGPYLEAARRSLAELAEEASPRGLTLGLENRYHYHEFPQIDEALELLAPYPPELVGYWHDVGPRYSTAWASSTASAGCANWGRAPSAATSTTWTASATTGRPAGATCSGTTSHAACRRAPCASSR